MKHLLLTMAMTLLATVAIAQTPATVDTCRQTATTGEAAKQPHTPDGGSIIKEDGWTGDYYLYNSYHPKESCHSFDMFKTTFLELSGMTGWHQSAIGLTLAYVPGRWGGYLEGYCGSAFNTLNCGGVFRVMDDSHLVDWQLYGGLAAGYAPGLQLGTRFASGRMLSQRQFSWWSFSISSMWMGGEQYTTFGISLGLAATGLCLIWW